MDKDISRRIWITRYLMVIGIIVLHLPPFQSLRELGTSFFDVTRAFFAHGVFRATVPVLTVLSGFLVFHYQLQLKPLKLLAKKSSSVLLPLIIWNIPPVIAIFLAQRYSFVSHDFTATLYPVEPMNWVNALTGFLGVPANYPLAFLRDLFAVSLLSPLYWLFLKRTPYLGLLLVLVAYYFNLDGPIVLRNTMLVSFYIGGLAATQHWDLTYLDRHAKWLLMLFVAICMAIAIFDAPIRNFLRLVSPFLVWPSICLIVNTRFGDFLHRNSDSSFFTFLAHGPIILVMWLVYQRLPLEAPYFLYWLLAPPLTVYIAILLSNPFRKLLPRTASIVLGGR